jgi:uncharacterized RDD family membrane protein YckC
MSDINKGIRVINFIIDYLVINLFVLILVSGLNQLYYFKSYFIVGYFLYYFIFEFISGKTIGKIITKTHVVDCNNNKPKFFRIVLRTILRFNPFDIASFIFGFNQGAHDKLSRTKIILK